MRTLHMASTPFFGGPERQMLGLATAMSAGNRPAFLLFPDRGKSREFQVRLEEEGLETQVLRSDTPHLRSMVREVVSHLQILGAEVCCSHGYKADVVGLLAARKAGIPVVAV